MDDKPRMATVVCATPTLSVYSLSKAFFVTTIKPLKEPQQLIRRRRSSEDTRDASQLSTIAQARAARPAPPAPLRPAACCAASPPDQLACAPLSPARPCARLAPPPTRRCCPPPRPLAAAAAQVGKGAYGLVFLVEHDGTKDKYALKAQKKIASRRDNMFQERNLMADMIPHPCVCCMFNTYQVRRCPRRDLRSPVPPLGHALRRAAAAHAAARTAAQAPSDAHAR